MSPGSRDHQEKFCHVIDRAIVAKEGGYVNLPRAGKKSVEGVPWWKGEGGDYVQRHAV